jgi:sulfite exporter TauE/SafE
LGQTGVNNNLTSISNRIDEEAMMVIVLIQSCQVVSRLHFTIIEKKKKEEEKTAEKIMKNVSRIVTYSISGMMSKMLSKIAKSGENEIFERDTVDARHFIFRSLALIKMEGVIIIMR